MKIQYILVRILWSRTYGILRSVSLLLRSKCWLPRNALPAQLRHHAYWRKQNIQCTAHGAFINVSDSCKIAAFKRVICVGLSACFSRSFYRAYRIGRTPPSSSLRSLPSLRWFTRARARIIIKSTTFAACVTEMPPAAKDATGILTRVWCWTRAVGAETRSAHLFYSTLLAVVAG